MDTIAKIQKEIEKKIEERTKAAQEHKAAAEAAAARVTESKAELDRLIANNAEERKIAAAVNTISEQTIIKDARELLYSKYQIITPAEATQYAQELYNALAESDRELSTRLQQLHQEIKTITEKRQASAAEFLNVLCQLESYGEPGTSLIAKFSKPPVQAITVFSDLAKRPITFDQG